MKTHLSVAGFAPGENTTPSLSDMVNNLARTMEKAAMDKKSFIINDIPDNILIDTYEDVLASVLVGLMQEVTAHTENGCIRVTAKKFNDIILLHIKNDGSLICDSVSLNLTKLQPQAEKLGGFVGFTSYRNKITTIAFSFTNKKEITEDLQVSQKSNYAA